MVLFKSDEHASHDGLAVCRPDDWNELQSIDIVNCHSIEQINSLLTDSPSIGEDFSEKIPANNRAL